eukprot:5960946-Amphidinium_carterae.1
MRSTFHGRLCVNYLKHRKLNVRGLDTPKTDKTNNDKWHGSVNGEIVAHSNGCTQYFSLLELLKLHMLPGLLIACSFPRIFQLLCVPKTGTTYDGPNLLYQFSGCRHPFSVDMGTQSQRHASIAKPLDSNTRE